MFRFFGVIFFLVIPVLLVSAGGAGQEEGLTFAAVQFEITSEKVMDFELFQASVTRRVEEAVDAGAQVVVFLEYTNSFLSLLPYRDLVAQSSTVEEFLKKLRYREPDLTSPADLFASSAFWVRLLIDELYGSLARKYEIYLVAGTYFHQDPDLDVQRVSNRLVMYDPTGQVIHEQDKVFLTPFESVALGLSPGRLATIEPVVIENLSLGFTICRDAFQSDWDSLYFGTDVLVDLKAENVDIEEQPWDYVSEAIPERVQKTEADYGLTVHLVGSFLDLFWEGSTSLFNDSKGELTQFLGSPNDPGVLVVELN